jgi:uncharacterized protein YjbJ (UPF0337 family)
MGSTMEKMKGRLKEAVGVLTDNDRRKRAGQRDQGMGEVQDRAERAAAEMQDKVERAVEKMQDA